MKSQSPEFRFLSRPEFGEIKSLEFGLQIKPRKWEFYENIAKYELF